MARGRGIAGDYTLPSPAVISVRQLVVGRGQVGISLDVVLSIKVLSDCRVNCSGMSLKRVPLNLYTCRRQQL